MLICKREQCTACGACLAVCPKQCISWEEDRMHVRVANADDAQCVHCDLCKRVCPQVNKVQGGEPSACYAAWSTDVEIRKTSASGGIAAELYRYEEVQGGHFSGVTITPDGYAYFDIGCSLHDAKAFQNSKYVYSDLGEVYFKIYDLLASGSSFTFIGLPCQVAGLKSFLQARKMKTDALVTVDLVCHGTTPAQYLKNHIQRIERKKAQKATEVLFRDPSFGTNQFVFSLKHGMRSFYHKRVHRNDSYQIGYHYGITYRENCYHCPYASPIRQGDITLADFSGVGSVAECGYSGRKVSCILVNTPKGAERIAELLKQKQIFAERRPLEEEFRTEKQLRAPTKISTERLRFIQAYSLNQNFEHAVFAAARHKILRNEIKHYLHIEDILRIIRRIVPKSVKNKLKRSLKGK